MISNELKVLSDPAISLQLYGTIQDQKTGEIQRYDPFRLTDDLQQTVLGYVSDPPRDAEGRAKWLTVLKGRQCGCSTTTALALYAKAAYSEGLNTAIIADNQDRANGLFERIMLNHQHWDESVKVEQQSSNEVRSFTTKYGSRVRVLSGHSDAVGVGRSIDILHASELALWSNASKQFSMLTPAMINRDNAMIVQECTPFPMSESSAQFWQDQCRDAQLGMGRYIFAFFPFWDTKLCRRPWPVGQKPDSEEERLMEAYAHQGLTLENLAFRRETMDSDPEIRRDTELFSVFYPFDPYNCWRSTGSGVIPAAAVDKFKLLMPEPEGLVIFQDPDPSAQYVIGVDPSGYGRDHAAFQVLEVWGDEWRQAAVYGKQCDPNDFAQILFDAGIKYNRALIGVERNGPGVACTALLRQLKYPRIFHDAHQKPGMHKSNHDEWVALLVDALLDKLKLYGSDTVSQTRGYRSDKLTERSVRSELLSSSKGNRRPRHHWDRVSALMVACATAPYLPMRYRPIEKPDNVVPFSGWSWDQIEAYRTKLAALSPHQARPHRRAHYRKK